MHVIGLSYVKYVKFARVEALAKNWWRGCVATLTPFFELAFPQ